MKNTLFTLIGNSVLRVSFSIGVHSVVELASISKFIFLSATSTDRKCTWLTTIVFTSVGFNGICHYASKMYPASNFLAQSCFLESRELAKNGPLKRAMSSIFNRRFFRKSARLFKGRMLESAGKRDNKTRG